ncbi:MAG: tRNA (cytidine(34)-2'-O)-methyltransferase [Clostridiales bacterium]|nr:tRNA (cytidine(34)-2'-O)-methyltransferase [Clostridiales bacterium]
MINIVLVEPEIPQNAGNIVRTCAATGCNLHMVRPLGFELDDKKYKRAGLDYFPLSNIKLYDSIEEIFEENKNATFYFASTKSKKTYADVTYPDGCFVVFGKESYGLREDLLKAHYDNCIRVPMKSEARSLNLSNTVAIITYEAMRQQNFAGLQNEGELTGRSES